MSQQLSLLENTPSAPKFKTARSIELWCAEPVFFASRELSDRSEERRVGKEC